MLFQPVGGVTGRVPPEGGLGVVDQRTVEEDEGVGGRRSLAHVPDVHSQPYGGAVGGFGRGFAVSADDVDCSLFQVAVESKTSVKFICYDQKVSKSIKKRYYGMFFACLILGFSKKGHTAISCKWT